VPAVPPAGAAEPLYGAHIEVSGDGRYVYASARGKAAGSSCIAVFRVADDGALAVPAVQFARGVAWPRDFVQTADGGHLLVVNQHADSVCVFARDAASGELTLRGEFSTAPTRAPACVVVVK
jgi:6-phosphogluconolactonase